jgi:hypothetical protein
VAKTRLVRVEGIADGAIDPNKDLITFSLSSGGRKTEPPFVAPSHIVEQIAMGLGGLLNAMKEAKQRLGVPFSPHPVHAESVARYGVKADAFAQAVLIHFESDQGIPYKFAIPTERVADIVARLQTEAAEASKRTKPGTA